VPHGDHFVVTGQKTWNSYADAPADWCFLLARTDPARPKHQGLSVLLVDMRTPGITVRPIDTMAGPHEFTEIFFDEVVVPREQLLGDEHAGWGIVMAGLTFERAGIARYARAGRIIAALVEWAKAASDGSGRVADCAQVRQALADLRARYEAARLLNYRVISQQAAGEVPSVEASIARLHNTQLEQRVGHVGLELLGLGGLLTHDAPEAPLDGLVYRQWVRNIPTTVAAESPRVRIRSEAR
jgi:alkylation response protein AidB-like acyl-CoA dehydrogenase